MNQEQQNLNEDIQVQEGMLPITWRDILSGFATGETKRFHITNIATVVTLRSHITKYQRSSNVKFSSRSEGEFLYVTRLK